MGQTFSFFVKFLRDQLFATLPETHTYPAQPGRTFLVTGSNTGIGLGLALHLARLQPALLILAVRDLTKGEKAKEAIIAQTGLEGKLEVWALDMADFGSVIRFAARANSALERLDGANLNAGIEVWDWKATADGWERTLQVNALSTGLLAVLLLPLLQKTTKLPPPHPDALQTPPHLTITGSSVQFLPKFPERSAPNILAALNDEHKSDIMDRYYTTKLFNLFITRELASLPKAEGVVVNVVDPGFCASEIGRDLALPAFVLWLLAKIAWTPEKGALNLLYAMLVPTPPAAYVSTAAVSPPPAWIRKPKGVAVQAKVWSEMVQVWKGLAPEVEGIVAVV
ncbi:hypothetical protein C8R46DRAFT_1206146 [Mycena filopes]|nr:hypothetical protein C8R46DRAFT_1206146 [Mycena filopes]